MKELFFELSQSWQLEPLEMTGAIALWLVVVSAIVLSFVATFAGVTSWVERRVAGRMMSRIGPNRVGPQGFLQWMADGLKCFLKEDVIPNEVDKPLFRFAPYLVFTGTFAAFAALPFGYGIVAADLNIGIFYVTAITALVVIGILMAGWSSNNKWSLLGGVRSAAQIVSYEIPSGLAILSVVVLAGTLNLQAIIAGQGGFPWDWYIFNNPFTLMAFFIFFASILAEGNRTPFDLPEAESELVAGYLTEYSGMRFVFFFFGEWANLWVMSALITTLFLGGWQIPGVADLAGVVAGVQGAAKTLWILLSVVVFFAKTLVLVFVVIWIRWTLPRLRVDQLMVMCWKYFVPFGFLCMMGSALFVLIAQSPLGETVHLVVRLALTGLGGLVLLLFVRRTILNVRELQDPFYFKVLE
ncbi:MAG: NADH-quinone oxidoreductase subunit NuoH [Acidobacteria bacterium]|nr:NADH-quinone oxidoreductase subunit NuoH [Acidobacteriota bacterium]